MLDVNLPWLTNINRPTQTKRIPSVLTKDEVAGVLTAMEGKTALLARLLYGTGMRLMEGMRLRIKDMDFDRPSLLFARPRAIRTAWRCCPVRWHLHCGYKCWQQARGRSQIGNCNLQVLKSPMRWQ